MAVLLLLLAVVLFSFSIPAHAESPLDSLRKRLDKEFTIGLANGALAGFGLRRAKSLVSNSLIVSGVAASSSLLLGYADEDHVLSSARDYSAAAAYYLEQKVASISFSKYSDTLFSFISSRRRYCTGAFIGFAVGSKL